MNSKITKEEYFKKLESVGKQIDELDRVTEARVTCSCGVNKHVVEMYHCLYCEEWYCKSCAEEHFGKTVKEWREDNPNPF